MQIGWSETVVGLSNAIATATHAAETDKQHVIMSCTVSYNATGNGKLEIKDGATVIWTGQVYDSRDITFPQGMKIADGAACSAVLEAGGGSLVGYVNLQGISR